MESIGALSPEDIQQELLKCEPHIKDKTLQVKIYCGTFVHHVMWIDVLCWRNYDFNITEYLSEEFGVKLPTTLMYDVLAADDEFITRTCFKRSGNDSVFSITKYDSIQYALCEHSEEVVEAALEVGVNLDEIDDKYVGHYKSFEQFVRETFAEYNSDFSLVNKDYVQFINFEELAEDWKQGYHTSEGHVFNAN